MTDPVQLIPLDAIDEAALPRDRTASDEDALTELRTSILRHGLRMPIEIWELSEPRGDHRFGLISGFRRLAAFRELHDAARDKTRFPAIPAFVRRPATIAEALAAMVEENAVRAEISPWEQAMVAIVASDEKVFATVDAAVDQLYASFNRQKRARIRAVAAVADVLSDAFAAPETLSLRQLMRLSTAVNRSYAPLIRTALEQASLRDPASQWQTVLPIIVEAESGEPDEPDAYTGNRGGRPRRMLRPRPGLTIRREMSRDGWILRFTGREASGMLIDRVLDEIEQIFSPG